MQHQIIIIHSVVSRSLTVSLSESYPYANMSELEVELECSSGDADYLSLSTIRESLLSMKVEELAEQLIMLQAKVKKTMEEIADHSPPSEHKNETEEKTGIDQIFGELCTAIECANRFVDKMKQFAEHCQNVETVNCDTSNRFLDEASQSAESLKRACNKINHLCIEETKNCNSSMMGATNGKQRSQVVTATSGTAAAGVFVLSTVGALTTFGTAAIIGFAATAMLGAGSTASAIVSKRFGDTVKQFSTLSEAYTTIAELAFKLNEFASKLKLKVGTVSENLQEMTWNREGSFTNTAHNPLEQLKSICTGIHPSLLDSSKHLKDMQQ